jgi:hypothetical protein
MPPVCSNARPFGPSPTPISAMSEHGHTGSAKPKKRASQPRYATRADIEQLTRAIDRIRDDSTRYLICMTLDLITQNIVERQVEEEGAAGRALMN